MNNSYTIKIFFKALVIPVFVALYVVGGVSFVTHRATSNSFFDIPVAHAQDGGGDGGGGDGGDGGDGGSDGADGSDSDGGCCGPSDSGPGPDSAPAAPDSAPAAPDAGPAGDTGPSGGDFTTPPFSPPHTPPGTPPSPPSTPPSTPPGTPPGTPPSTPPGTPPSTPPGPPSFPPPGGGGGGSFAYNYYPPTVSYYAMPQVTLTQVPYTGLDMGPIATALYWLFLAAWALFGTYLIAIKRTQNNIARKLNVFLFGSN